MLNETDDLTQRYMGSREQDLAAIDSEALRLQAEKQDDEAVATQMIETSLSQTSPTDTDPLPDANGEPELTPPDADGEPELMLPNADGELSNDIIDLRSDVSDPRFEGKDSDIMGYVSATAKFVERMPRNISIGTVSALHNAQEAILPGIGKATQDALTDMGLGSFVEADKEFFDKLRADSSGADRVTQEMSTFFVPFSLYMKGLGATTKLGMITKGFAAEAAASFFNLDPHMERLSQVSQELGFSNDLIAWMADESGTDLDNRLRNTIENTVGSAAIGGTLFVAAKTLKGSWWGSKTLAKKLEKEGAEKLLVGAAVTAGAEEAEAGTFGGDILDAIKSRKAATEEALGDGIPKQVGKGAKQEKKPKETRTDQQILMSLPDAVFMDWQGGADANMPIKEFLHKKHPSLIGGK